MCVPRTTRQVSPYRLHCENVVRKGCDKIAQDGFRYRKGGIDTVHITEPQHCTFELGPVNNRTELLPRGWR